MAGVGNVERGRRRLNSNVQTASDKTIIFSAALAFRTVAPKWSQMYDSAKTTAKMIGQPVMVEPAIRRRLNPCERRAQLLEHAISAFAEAGIERAVHADVASRANVSTPTVFKYFPTREALVDAVLSEVEDSLVDLKNVLPKGVRLSPAELVRAVSQALSQLCTERPDLMKVSLIWSVAFSNVRARYLSFGSRILDMFEELLDPEKANEADRLIIFANVKFFIRMHFNETPEDVRWDLVNRMSEIFEAAAASSE